MSYRRQRPTAPQLPLSSPPSLTGPSHCSHPKRSTTPKTPEVCVQLVERLSRDSTTSHPTAVSFSLVRRQEDPFVSRRRYDTAIPANGYPNFHAHPIAQWRAWRRLDLPNTVRVKVHHAKTPWFQNTRFIMNPRREPRQEEARCLRETQHHKAQGKRGPSHTHTRGLGPARWGRRRKEEYDLAVGASVTRCACRVRCAINAGDFGRILGQDAVPD